MSLFLANCGAITTPSASVGYDSDAQAYFTASGLSDVTATDAVNQLVLDLKGYSLWTKVKALYPFPGTAVGINKYNLKDPRDLDAAFRLTEHGTVTHDALGVTGDGSTGYFDTHVDPSANLSSSSTTLHLYSNTASPTNDEFELARYDGSNQILFGTRWDASHSIITMYAFQVNPSNGSSSAGNFMASRTSTATIQSYKNGSLISSASSSVNGRPTGNLFLLARNSGAGANSFSTKTISSMGIFTGFDDTEAANFDTAIQTYQTALSRNV